jgi:hypothetical protein
MRQTREQLLKKKAELEQRIADAAKSEREQLRKREDALKVRLGVLFRSMLEEDADLRAKAKAAAKRFCTRQAEVELFDLTSAETFFDRLGQPTAPSSAEGDASTKAAPSRPSEPTKSQSPERSGDAVKAAAGAASTPAAAAASIALPKPAAGLPAVKPVVGANGGGRPKGDEVRVDSAGALS